MKAKFSLTAFASAFSLLASFACSAQDLTPGVYKEVVRANNGPLNVTTTLSKNRIEKIEIGDSYETDYIAKEPMNSVAREIVARQTLGVDTVAGATEATQAVIRAVGQSIEKAGGSIVEFTPNPEINPEKFPLETKTSTLIIAGGSISSFVAAIKAASLGTSVTLLTKNEDPVGDIKSNFGLIKLAKSNEDEAKLLKAWTKECSLQGGSIDSKAVKAITDNAFEASNWLKQIGINLTDFSKHSNTQIFMPEGVNPFNSDLTGLSTEGGKVFAEKLLAAAKKAGVNIISGVTLTKITGNSTEVTGLNAFSANAKKRFHFQAKNVLLADGGYARDVERIIYLARDWTTISGKTLAPKTQSGDAIRLASDLGAKISDDGWMQGTTLEPVYPSLKKAYLTHGHFSDKVLVNDLGNRFVAEDRIDIVDEAAKQKSVWLITDSLDTKATKILRDYLTFEVAVDGNDWSELARRMAVPAQNLEKTMQEYNKRAKLQKDILGKNSKYLIARETGPFYAIKLTPVSVGSVGGLVVNSKGEVLSEKGSPIKGLFASGETANEAVFGNHVPLGAANLQEVVSGLEVAKILSEKN